MKHTCYSCAIAIVAILGAARVVPAATISSLSGPADFTSPITFTDDFETGLPNGVPANSSQFTYEGTDKLGLAEAWTDGQTSSGRMGLVATVDSEPLRIVFNTPVHEVGMYFGNDDFGRLFYATLELFDENDDSLGAVQVRSNGNDFADQFIGARSGIAAKSAAISYERPNAQLLAVYIDDLIVGALVPEPSSAALAASGLLWLAAGAFRRRSIKYPR